MVRVRKFVLASGIFGVLTAFNISPAVANPPRTVPFNIGQPVTLNSGDSATITLILTTSDPNEDGEHEGVVVSGSAGGKTCAKSVLEYFMPVVFQCGPVPDGTSLTLTSYYIGFDGDEAAAGEADINIPSAAKKTQNQIDAWEKASEDEQEASETYDTMAALCTAPTNLVFLSAWTEF